MAGTHDTALVALSVLIATIAAYTALDLAGRVRASTGGARLLWLATAALAMGGGVWSMHFVAMLAFSVPDLPVGYALGPTALSLVVPIGVTGLGFHMVSRQGAGFRTLALSGLVMGVGIAAMHYGGMAAMRMPATLSHDHLWVALSLLIAIGASTVALWLAFGRASEAGFATQAVAAAAMGLAVSGMHYAAMQGASFSARPWEVDGAQGAASLDQTRLALAVAATTFLILFLALVAAMFDRRFAHLAAREAAALKESEERFRTLYKRTPLPLYTLGQDLALEHVSDAWLALMGFSRREVIGRSIRSFMTSESAAYSREVSWPTLIRQGELHDAEFRLVAKDGRIIDVLVSAKVESDASGRFVRALCGLVDVTARKRAEEALRQTQKIEAVGALTGGVAHDFNNLLMAVLGSLELLKKRLPDDPRALRLIDNAVQGAERGAALTQRLLAFARRQDLKPEAVTVPDLVRGMADLLQHSIGPMVRIDTRFPLDLPRARADANQLELALMNLVVNARDAMPEGGTITIAAEQVGVGPGHAAGLPPGPYVCLSVSDTGEGMDEATLARASEPFFTTKGVGKGTGLGLSMVHGLAEQSGGRLVLASAKGQGTRAEIWLPAAEAAGAGDSVPARSGLYAEPRAVLQPATVLVVDDDALVLTNTAELVEDLGHRALQASSGDGALSLLRGGAKVDVVITDHAMPGMTGTQLAAAIKARWPGLAVILASGYAEFSADTDPTLPRLAKPFQQATLAEVIAAALRAGEEAGRVVPFRSRHG